MVADFARCESRARAVSRFVPGQEQPGSVLVGLIRPCHHAVLRASGSASTLAVTLDGPECTAGTGTGRLLAGQQAVARAGVRRVHVSRTSGVPNRGPPP